MPSPRRIHGISFVALSGLAIAGLASPGCGPANPAGRIAVSGHVTVDGVPVDDGMIEFAPLDQGLGSGAVIADGKYSIEAHRGLPPGRYTVRIYATTVLVDGKPIGPNNPAGPTSIFTSVDRVAARFNSKSKLIAEVPAGAKAKVFDFEVSGKE